MVRDVPVGEVLDDPLGEGQRLDLVCGDRVAQNGSAQVAQAGYRHRRLPEPDVTVSGSVMNDGWLVFQVCVGTEIHLDKNLAFYEAEHFPKWPQDSSVEDIYPVAMTPPCG